MKRFAIDLAVFAVAALVGAAWAGADKAEQPLRLELDLTDGSRVIGTPGIESVPVQTSYAKMDVPLKQIRTLKIGDDHETAAVDLRNGDKVKGVINLEPIKLETVFGKVSVGVAHIRELRVVAGGDLMRGLVLHYSFDRDENGKVLDGSGRGHHGTIGGQVRYEDTGGGKAVRTSSRDTYVICDAAGLNLGGWRQLTVSAWIKIDAHTTYGALVNHGRENTGDGFAVSIGGEYGGKSRDCAFSVAFGGQAGEGASVTAKRFAEPNRWYQVAGVYDGRTVKYYVNGREEGSADVPAQFRDAGLMQVPGTSLVIGKSAYRWSWHDTHINGLIDDVRIYNRALSADEIGQDYRARQ